jgi:thiol-disulfide isomerase/thioredoxin
MNVSFGRFTIQAVHLLLLSAVVVAALVGNCVGRKDKVRIGPVLIEMMLVGMLAGRLVFVATWFDLYRKVPVSILDIGDGGFTLWAALSAAAALGLWRVRNRRELLDPLAAGVLAGGLAWFMSGGTTLLHMRQDKTVPSARLATPLGASAGLAEVAKGRPMVVNLWATWCPPCRREMPVLAAAQMRHSNIAFAFVNQGEDAEAIIVYLNKEGLRLENVLLDPKKSTGLAVGSTALPTTLLYDPAGKLVDVHLGALSEASLESKLANLRKTSALR